MTYYKYAERDASSQINWAEVSKGLSDTIAQVDKDRQAKKAAIDASTREAMTTLADAPSGENTTASEWTIKYANDMMNYRLTLDRLLKSGQMKLSDYQVAAQNSVDSTNLVFTLAKEYQDQYKVIMDRSRTINPETGMPESSRLEPDLAALNESFANISNTVPTINSTNGMVYLSNPEIGEDGVQKLGKNYVSLQALRNRVNAKIDAYSLPNGITNAVNQLGENTISELGKTSFRRTGVVTDITDPTLRNTYTQWEDATIKKIMASDYQLASILADNMNINPRTGNQYTATYSKEEFDADKSGDLILMENQNGSGVLIPKFKEEQRKDAEAYIKSQMTSYIDKKAKKDVFTEPDVYRPSVAEMEYYKGVSADKDRSKNNLNMAAKLYYGNNKDAEAAAQYFRDIIPNVKEVDRNSLGVVLTFNDGSSRTIKFKDANQQVIPQDAWLASATALHGITDVNTAIKQSGYKPSGAFNPNSSAKSFVSKPAAPPNAQQKAKNYLTKTITPEMINQEEEVAVPQILSAINKLGFDAEESDWGGNYVTITAPSTKDRAGAKKEFPVKTGANAAQTAKNIIEFVTANLTSEQLANADLSGGLEGSTFGSSAPARKINKK